MFSCTVGRHLSQLLGERLKALGSGFNPVVEKC